MKHDGPLSGIRVLDLSRVVMGPLATQILADQGADVIMVEPMGGDTNRVMGAGPHPEFSGIALNLLRNKRSVSLDLKTSEGMSALHRLIKSSDVVVATMRPNALRRLNLDYDSVKKLVPNVIYCQAQGFPLGSDRSDEPAYDDIIQAASGLSDVMERVWGEPALVPTILADKLCGIVMAQAITAALFHRERTGVGQHVEVPMQQATTAFVLVEHGSGAISEPPVSAPGHPAEGYTRVLSKERRPHRSKDGLVHIFPYLPRHYAVLFDGAKLPNGEEDRRYVDQRQTLINSDSLYRDVRKLGPSRTTAEWLAFCKTEGIPATEVATLRGLIEELPQAVHPVVGSYRVVPQMSIFSESPGQIRLHAPLIGEHSDEVIAGLPD